MPRFDLKDYIEVKDRIARFWEKYPDGAIVTELLYVDDHVVRFKAEAYEVRSGEVSHKPLGIGHAEEYRITEAQIKNNPKLQYEPNVTSAVENCETSAVGRALAMAGFEVSKSVASRQEMEKVARQQAAREAERKESEKSLDKPEESATVDSNGAEPKTLEEGEARELAGQIKATGIETSAVKLKLLAMGVETPKTLATALQTMTREQAQELHSWVVGEQNT